MSKPIILCMFWGEWGKPYGLEYVFRLKRMVDRNINIDYDFVCMTDRIMGKEDHGIHWKLIPERVLRWRRNLPKFYMYRDFPEFRNRRILFFDLDTVIVGSILDFIKYKGRMCTVKPFNRRMVSKSTPGGVLAFEGGEMKWLWEAVEKDPLYWSRMSEGGKERLVLQELKKRDEKEWDYFQDLFPGQLVSYKRDLKNMELIPTNARVVVFHGTPRPHQIMNRRIVKNYWK